MRYFLCTILLFAISTTAFVADAADVFYSGEVTTSSDYSDAGSDLGNEGFWFANFDAAAGVNDAPADQDAVNALPSYATITFGSAVDSAGGWGGYVDLTLPNNTVGNSGALEINNAFAPAGTQEEYLTLTFGAGVPQNLNIGVVIDNSDGVQFSNSEILVNGVSTGVLTNDLAPDVHTFNILNILPGDTVQIDGITSTDSTVSHLGGLLLDNPAVLPSILELEVNTTTGQVNLLGSVNGDVDIDGYTIESAAGSLNPAGWSSLADNPSFGNGNPNDGIGWENGGAISTVATEYKLQGSSTFGPGGTTSVGLGSLFSPGGTEDIEFEYSIEDGALVSGTVTYVTVGTLEGDFDGSNAVGNGDLTLLLDNWGEAVPPTPTGWVNDFPTTPGVGNDDLTRLLDNWGNTIGTQSAVTAVPEPNSLAMLLLAAGILVLSTSCRRMQESLSMTCQTVPKFTRLFVAILALVCTSSAAMAAVTNDRVYQFGDDGLEDAANAGGGVVGSGPANVASGATLDSGEPGDPSGSFLDLVQSGSPVYTDVGALGRPGASAGDRGILFDGVDDRLQGTPLNVPEEMALNLGTYPFNYTNISSRGLQMWVYPDSAKVGNGRQAVVMDSIAMGGVAITADGMWTQINDGHADDTSPPATVPVVGDTWHHVMHHVYPSSNAGAPLVVPGTGSGDLGFTGVIYVNGVAVSANNDSPVAGDLTAGTRVGVLSVGAEEMSGADPDPIFDNYFQGTIDNLEMYIFEDNSASGGQNHGPFDLFSDNAWIANEIATTVPGGTLNLGDVNRDGTVNGDGSGDPAVDDVSAFIDGWRFENQLVGAHNATTVGDWNTWGMGDMDLDGEVGLLDWHLLRANHPAGLSLDLEALLAAASVPEPSSFVLVAIFMLTILLSRGLRLNVYNRSNTQDQSLPSGFRLASRASSFAAAGLAMLIATSSQAADLWNVDFQGDGTTSGGFFGQDTVPHDFGPSPVSGEWNIFTVPSINADPQLDFATNPSMSLVDNDGAASSVSVTLTGDYAGWSGLPGIDDLVGDYIILLADGRLGFPTPTLSMDVTGLTPNTFYSVRLFSGVDAARDMNILVDTNGDGSLNDETTVLGAAGGVATTLEFTSSAAGGMKAQLDLGSVVESNLSAMQIQLGAFEPVLTIDRATGEMTLANSTGEPLTVTAYTVESNTVGALNPGSWLSITDNYDMNNGGSVDATHNWFEFTAPTDRDNLSEAQSISTSGTVIANGQMIDLGAAWIRSPNEDISMDLLLEDGTLQNVLVRYSGDPKQVGDLDFDGDIDVADWNIFKPGLIADLSGLSSSEAYGMGDLDNDGIINLVDARAFEAAFDTANGLGAFAAMVSAVPEPNTCFLLLLGSIGITGISRRFWHAS